MLAKLWKKVLLAICIVACIFNIMSKLVNRHSLKENLDSANDGVTVFNFFQKKDVQVSESEEIIDGVIKKEENNIVNETTSGGVTEENTEIVVEEQSVQETPKEEVKENTTEIQETPENTDSKKESKDDKTFSFSDFTIIF